MDSVEQAAGEKRVMQMLIEPLMRRGLAKPASLTRAQFEDMIADLCKRLAYMTGSGLAALEEQAACNPSGKGRDRMPIGNDILGWAGKIEPPGDDASPFMRKLFAHQIGLDALAGGWAPELLVAVRARRNWPQSFAISQMQRKGDEETRRLRLLEERLARGDVLDATQAEWRARRLADIRRCERIRELGLGTGA